MSEKNLGGRPPKFKTPEELDALIESYFSGGHRIVQRSDKEGNLYDVSRITLTDLCLYLGFCDKSSIYDYEKREGFSHSIKRARMLVEREYEERLDQPNAAGSIFALKNFGWRDKQEIEMNIDPPRIIFDVPRPEKPEAGE